MTEPSLPEESIFAQALEIASTAERAAFLDRACGNNQALRAEVEALLRASERSGDLLDLPENPVLTTDLPAHERPGTVIGPYKLLEQIGEGGMGTVWMAEQTEPIQRRVAVKVVKEGMDSRQVLARFEAERQALALMEHPNIAKVLDAGKTPAGRPYFVMELVKGQPITKYCDEKRLGVRERLDLFGDVCRAVQHAHQKGIIHRDLKPSNVLVAPYDGKPVVKVIDFGVAKATGQRLTDRTLFTGFGALVGTPEYMSPEQAEVNNQDIDTRSDVYSLGVLLYELLTGSTPLTRKRIKEAALLEVLRVIREEEPPRPSTRLSESKDALPSISAQRQMEPARLTRLVRGELDWITMRALEKDRNRRYETANGLALDVQRYLADEPVQACPPSASYRLRKFVRRHRSAVTVAAAMVVLVLAATVVSAWQAVRATLAEEKTGKALIAARDTLDAVIDDVVVTMFAKQPKLDDSEKEFLRKVLEQYQAVASQVGASPENRYLRAKGAFQVARLRATLGEFAEGIAGFREAALLLEQLVEDCPTVAKYRKSLASTNSNLAIRLAQAGQDREAETAFRRCIELHTKLAAEFPDNIQYRNYLATNHGDLGLLLERRNNLAPAAQAFATALDIEEKVVAEAGNVAAYRLDLARIRLGLAMLRRKQGKLDEADELHEKAVAEQEKQLEKSPDVPKQRQDLAHSYQGWGIVRAEQGRMDDAEKKFARAIELRKRLTVDFPRFEVYRRDLGRNYNDLGYLLMLEKKFPAAEEAYRHALDIQEKMVAERGSIAAHREDAANTYTNLGKLHQQRKAPAEALPMLDKARAHLKIALDANAKNPVARRLYQENLRTMADSYGVLGDHARLAATADELAGFGYAPAEDTYAAASMVSGCIALVDKDTELAAAQRKDLAESYAEKSLKLLRQAVERGFTDAARMQKDPRLEPLRERPEYRKLLAELEGK
jgi:serine/threonine protein kinase